MISYLPIGVRAHTVRAPGKQSRSIPSRDRKGAMRQRATLPRFVLVIDTETTADDLTQQLNFACARYYEAHWRDPGYERLLGERETEPPHLSLLGEWLVHADNLPERDPESHRELCAYAASHRPDVDREHEWAQFGSIPLLSRRDFERLVLHPAAAETRAAVVFFNAPFDISRLAVGYSACRTGKCAGGFSFDLAEYVDEDENAHVNDYHKRWGVLHLDSKKAFTVLQPGRDDDNTFAGNIIDLKTLVFSLTNKAHTLESACDALGVPYTKRDVEHGRITPEYIDYCREDVDATVRLWRAAMIEYRRHPIGLPAERCYSPASIAKGYLDAMGVTEPRTRSVSDEVDGYACATFVGARAECRIRRTPVPVAPYDFKSMYPTVNALLGNWSLLTAERIEAVDDDPENVQAWLETISLDDCFERAFWTQLRAIALVQPDGDILPVRARYSDHGQGWNIGHNPLTSDTPLWFALPDLVASKLLTGKAPTILRVIRFEPHGRLEHLSPVKLRGERLVDPRKRDLYRFCVEQRQKRKNELKAMVAAGEITPEQADPENDPLACDLKVIANSGAYGLFVEVNRDEAAGQERITVYGLETFESETIAPEEPGRFYCPPIGTLITSAARLMLTMFERCISDLGGTHLMADTDALGVVASRDGGLVTCPGGPHRDDDGEECVLALSWEQTDAIARRFRSLNPYKRSLIQDTLELEPCAYEKGERIELTGYAISAKRYCYYTTGDDGSITIRKSSEHGLGQYLDPIGPEKLSDEDTIEAIWEWIVRTHALGQDVPLPEWINQPALRQHSISTPQYLRPLEALNARLPYAEQAKPFNFMAIATQVTGIMRAVTDRPLVLVQPFSRNPRDWYRLPWINIHEPPGGQRYRLGYYDHIAQLRVFDGSPRKGEIIIPVKRFRDVLEDYTTLPEIKSNAPDETVCKRQTRGLLQRRPVMLATVSHLGKESNQLEESLAGLHVDGDEDVQIEYPSRSQLPSRWTLALQVSGGLPDTRIAELTGLDRETTAAARNGGSHHKTTRAKIERFAAEHSAGRLRDLGLKPPHRPESCMAMYLAERKPPTCSVCGEPVAGPRATYCGRPGCKKAAYRARRTASA